MKLGVLGSGEVGGQPCWWRGWLSYTNSGKAMSGAGMTAPSLQGTWYSHA